MLVARQWRHLGSTVQTRVCYQRLCLSVLHTMLGILFFLTPHFIYTKLTHVGDRSYIFEICLSVEKCGYHDFVTESPKASGSLRSGIGRNETI